MNNKAKVLIVDDIKVNRNILVKIIEKNTNFESYTANNGHEALDLIKKNKPDIILLDVMMPDMDGFEVANKVKNNPKFADIPIIFITALTDEESKVKAFNCGGIDYITKPFSIKEVVSRITVQIRLKQQYEEIKLLNEQIIYEMSIAKNIQNSIMPKKSFTFPNLSIECKYIPFEEIGGDYFDVIEIEENVYLVFLVDITGHGIPASLYTMMLKSNLYYISKKFSSPEKIINQLNIDISNSLLEDYYPTAVLLRLDLNNMKLTFANAGHPGPLYFSKTNKTIEELENKNFSLGLNLNVKIVEKSIDIFKGDRIYIYTDGLINIEHENGTYTDKKSISEFLLDNLEISIKEQLKKLIEKNKKESINGSFEDDVTILGINIGE